MSTIHFIYVIVYKQIRLSHYNMSQSFIEFYKHFFKNQMGTTILFSLASLAWLLHFLVEFNILIRAGLGFIFIILHLGIIPIGALTYLFLFARLKTSFFFIFIANILVGGSQIVMLLFPQRR